MLTANDKQNLEKRGISEELFETQIKNFNTGFPYLKIISAATPKKGIKVLDAEAQKCAIEQFEQSNREICKFVPASGAATRMFKDLYEALDALKGGKELVPDPAADKFISNILKFPFFNKESILKLTLFGEALNLGAKPKGLIPFHTYKNSVRTPFEEHLVEGALYAKAKDGKIKLVVTVSPEHVEGFTTLLESVKAKFEAQFNAKYEVEFTTQSPATDTVAVNSDNSPFRNENGELFFRPGGHGALLTNLNAIDSDIIVVKNIDNVVHESLIEQTVLWKKVLMGQLVTLQDKVFNYLSKLEESTTKELLSEIITFLDNEFSIAIPELPESELIALLKAKLNRPIRVCGMVKNEGEPGGGPYIIKEQDGTTSLQILEEAQIEKSNSDALLAMKQATHFNPVDVVCAVKDSKGVKFDLAKYTDPATGFISAKSQKGTPIKIQELPGLWNGSMSNWNTQFIEVPVISFNPVKSVNDLLRPTHLI